MTPFQHTRPIDAATPQASTSPPHQASPRPARPAWQLRGAAAAVALALTACGGGGGTGADDIPPSAAFEGQLLRGTGSQFSDWAAGSCTDPRQKQWVRANLNEDYLFYREAPLRDIDPELFTGTVPELFDAYTVDGVPQDVFSFVMTQADADASFQDGRATTAGLSLQRDPRTQQIRIATVDPNGPAAAAGLRRGLQLHAVNGSALPLDPDTAVPVLSRAQFDALFASPSGTPVALSLSSPPDTSLFTVLVTTTTFSETPVPFTTVLTNEAVPSVAVGYLANHSFITPIAELQLFDTLQDFAARHVTDLVVDLRYNTGGYLFIASELAHMVAGPGQTTGKTFSNLFFNDKRIAEDAVEPFRTQIQPFFNTADAGRPLPTLNLPRVIVLTTGQTCSASEAFVSALRGIGVEVVLIGTTTCGKPYGSSQENNCGLSYFHLEFEGRNHLGNLVPVSGFTPTCPVSDDLDHALGDPAEGMLAAALSYVETGRCPVASASATTMARPRTVAQPIPELAFTPPHRSIQLRR